MKDTLIVNLIAESGAGKSTNAAILFTMLKDAGIEVELVTEYVKDMIWEERTGIFECQPYIFGKQLYKLQRINGKVDVIITDRPILLDIIYDPEQDVDFKKYILKKFNQFNNLNIYLERTKPFNPNGRNENSVKEAKFYDNRINDLLNELDETCYYIRGDEYGCNVILDMIKKELGD